MVNLSFPCKLYLVATFGVIIGVTGGILLALLPGFVKQKISQNLKLVNGSELFTNWEEPTLPVWLNVYLFNITNAMDVVNSGAKPILQQLGPYTYREYRKNYNITWNEGKTLISYNNYKSFVFEQSKSAGSLQDMITTLNAPVVAITNKMKDSHIFIRRIIDNLLKKEGLFVTETVENLLFKGYKINLIDKIQKLTKTEMLPDGKFALMKNNTSEGRFTIYTGVEDISNFGRTHSWNHFKAVSYWDDEYCNMINGSDTTIFPPFLTKETTIYAFSAEICRSIYLTFEQETEVEGIPVYRFTFPEELFISSSINSANKCFCKKPSFCGYSGLLNISACKEGAPIFISSPHYYQASKKFLDDLIGLSPIKEQHESFIDIEPNTGLILSANKRLQVNIHIENIQGFSIIQRSSGIFYPIMWVNESFRIPTEIADVFRMNFIVPILLGKFVLMILMGFGAMTVISVIVYATVYCRTTRTYIKKRTSICHLENKAVSEALIPEVFCTSDRPTAKWIQ